MRSFLSLKFVLFLSFNIIIASAFAQTVEEKIKASESVIDSLYASIDSLTISLEDLRLEKIRKDIFANAIPKTDSTDIILNHSAYYFVYDEQHEQPKWVAHIVPPYIINGNASRSNDFRTDSLVLTGSAEKADYWYSGYDRGHLAPSADFRWSKRALSESYFYSNMSPQRPDFNRERWAEVEGTIRGYVINSEEQVYVITGGVLKDGLPTIGDNNVSIPEFYYKIALDLEGDEKKAIGFLLPNKYNSKDVMHYAVSVDSIEAVTGLDFFPSLEDSLEEALESNVDYKLWQTGKNKGNRLPLAVDKLPKGTVNTDGAKALIGKKSTVCGTVVSTKLSSKSGAVFINLDKRFPNTVFSLVIWKNSVPNFSYRPELELINKEVCVTGKIEDSRGTPSIYLSNEKQIKFLEDEE